MQRLRILHVTPYFTNAWAYGGIPRLASAMVRGLARRGHEVTVCTTDACDATRRLTGEAAARTAEGADVRVFRNVSNRVAYHLQFFLPLGLGRYMKDHARTFDVAHLHACRNVPGAIAASHLRRAGVPYVLAPNGTAPRIERRVLAKAAFDLVAGARVLDDATRVIAVTEAERRQLRALHVPDSKVRVIPNPIDLDEFATLPPGGAFRARYRVPAGPLVLFLGRQTPRKRVDLLVRAFARVGRPDATLVIAGNDAGGGSEARGDVRALGLERQTIFTGLLRSTARLEAFVDADVVVYPGEDEIFGLVPLEALLAGVPVIVAGDSGCAEVVSATGGGRIVPNGDVEALARAIDDVLDNARDWRCAASAAAARVRTSYAADAVCARLEEMYDQMRAGA